MSEREPDNGRGRKRKWYNAQYRGSDEFRLAEAARKAAWYQQPEVKARRAAALRAWRIKNGITRKPRD